MTSMAKSMTILYPRLRLIQIKKINNNKILLLIQILDLDRGLNYFPGLSKFQNFGNVQQTQPHSKFSLFSHEPSIFE